MKLKKLIPLAGLTGIAAVAAPLVSSCGMEATEFVWEEGSDLPEIKPVKRSYTLPQTEEVIDVIDQATDDYLNDIKNDKTLFAKDMLNYWNEMLFNPEYTVDKASITLTNINFDYRTISYKVRINGTIDNSKNASKENIVFDLDMKNVQFLVFPQNISQPDGGTVFTPLLVFWALQTSDLSAVNTKKSMMMVLAEQYYNLFCDDTWYLECRLNYKSSDTTNTIHIDRSNSIQALQSVIAEPSFMTMLLRFTVYFQSTYLKDIEWKVQE